MTAQALAAALGLRPAGGNRWRGRCPSHGGRSLEVRQGDRAPLLKCWGGCDPGAVLAAAGLTFRDMGGAATPAERAEAARERADRERAEAAARQRGNATADAIRDLDARLPQLALAAMADGAEGDAAAVEYHGVWDRLRDLEAS